MVLNASKISYYINTDLIQQMLIAWVIFKVVMRGFMVTKQEERFLRLPTVFKPIQAFISNQIRYIACLSLVADVCINAVQ